MNQLEEFKALGLSDDILTAIAKKGFETPSAIQSLTIPHLRKLSAIVLRQRVSTAQRLSNWEAATLTDKQKLYAATDAWVCTAIYDKLLHTPKIKRPKA